MVGSTMRVRVPPRWLRIQRAQTGRLLELQSGADVWDFAVRAYREADRAEGISAANEALGALLGRLTADSVADVALALAVIPRFGIGSDHLSGPNLDDLVARMAFCWGDEVPS
jgi:hypothetical protein